MMTPVCVGDTVINLCVWNFLPYLQASLWVLHCPTSKAGTDSDFLYENTRWRWWQTHPSLHQFLISSGQDLLQVLIILFIPFFPVSPLRLCRNGYDFFLCFIFQIFWRIHYNVSINALQVQESKMEYKPTWASCCFCLKDYTWIIHVPFLKSNHEWKQSPRCHKICQLYYQTANRAGPGNKW